MQFMTRYGLVDTDDIPTHPMWLGIVGGIGQVYIPLQVVGDKYQHEPDPDRSPT